MDSIQILIGDCREKLLELADDSVDAIITDPPYHLTANKKGGSGQASANEDSPAGRARIGTGFMGKAWDGGGVAFDPETWVKAYRVLKPGGHLIAFGGSRTYHRLACAIEDAGFEIRDQIMWLYGSGFPKSLDVSKAIDKAAGAEREVISEGAPVARMIPGADQNATGSWIKDSGRTFTPTETAPATAEATEWEGWGTALKPAHEPIVVARKPLIGTVVENVLAHGTGAMNIDAGKIEVEDGAYARNCSGDRGHEGTRAADLTGATAMRMGGGSASDLGRWPANVVHDGSDEVLREFAKYGERGASAPVTGAEPSMASVGAVTGERARVAGVFHDDSGTAARFFYCAKATRLDRNEGLVDPGPRRSRNEYDAAGKFATAERLDLENDHPTVKPTALMRWLCRLFTPKGGTILDMFAGSGSTGKAAALEGFNAILMEKTPEYVPIIRARVAWALKLAAGDPEPTRKLNDPQQALF